MGTTEGLLQSCGDIDWTGGQDLRCVNQQPWGQKMASISPFRTTQLFQELLLELVLLKYPTNLQTKSNPFSTSLQNISNQITSLF